MKVRAGRMLAALAALSIGVGGVADAHKLCVGGKTVAVAGSAITVTPSRDWNRLDPKPGKVAETWTLDGEQLNDVTFYGGVAPGEPLVKERNRKRDPLPRLRSGTLLVEVPELLAGTYRAGKKISAFTVTSTAPGTFAGKPGVFFAYDYIDDDDLPRRGEARATIVNGRLFMVTYEAPRLSYFGRNQADFHALADTVVLR